MRIAHADLYRYALPLAQPLMLGQKTLHEREGMLLRIQDSEGVAAWGEIAPLPCFSAETLTEAQRATHSACKKLKAIPHLKHSSLRSVLNVELAEEAPPSTQFGIEQALLSLAARRSGMTLPRFLSTNVSPEIYLNGLLRNPDNWQAFIARMLQAKYRAVKLKVGRQSTREDVRLVRSVSEALPDAVALRLDANRAWSIDEASEFAEGVAGCHVTYIEEPLRDPALLPAFVDRDFLPVALDESVIGMMEGELDEHDYAEAVVLKPMLLGLRRALHLGRSAEALGITPVVSGAYESGVGTLALAALTTAFHANVPAGLTTYRRFGDDTLTPPLDLSGSAIDVSSLFRKTCQVKLNMLSLLFSI